MNTVKFLDPKGQVFFECRPAEARLAIQAVERYRKLGGKENERLAKLAKELFTEPNTSVTVLEGNFLGCLSNAIESVEKKDLEVNIMVVNTGIFAQMRKLRDIIELETAMEIIRTGRMATFWNIPVYVFKDVPQDIINLAHINDNGVIQEQFRFKFKQTSQSIIIMETVTEMQAALKKLQDAAQQTQ